MTKEENLRQYILERYCSMNNFSNAIGISPQTLSAIFKRGLDNSASKNFFKICNELGISSDALSEGKILPKKNFDSKEYTEFDYIFDQMLIDGEPLNDYEKSSMKRDFHIKAEGIREIREQLKPQFEYFDTPKGKFALDKRTGRRFFVAPDNTFIPYKDPKFIDKIIEEFNKQKDKE